MEAIADAGARLSAQNLLPILLVLPYVRGDWTHWVYCGLTRGGQRLVCLLKYNARLGITEWSPWHGRWRIYNPFLAPGWRTYNPFLAPEGALPWAAFGAHHCRVLCCHYHHAGDPGRLRANAFHLDQAYVMFYRPMRAMLSNGGPGSVVYYERRTWRHENIVIYDRSPTERKSCDISSWLCIEEEDASWSYVLPGSDSSEF